MSRLFKSKQPFYLQIAICIGNHTVILVQFGINLHEGVFQIAEIVSFDKHNNPFSPFEKTFFKVSAHFTCYHLLRNVHIVFLSFVNNPELPCVRICTDVTLEVRCSQTIRIE